MLAQEGHFSIHTHCTHRILGHSSHVGMWCSQQAVSALWELTTGSRRIRRQSFRAERKAEGNAEDRGGHSDPSGQAAV